VQQDKHMINKRLDVIVHGPDRQLFTSEGLRCSVIDIFNRQTALVDRRKVGPVLRLELDLPFDGPQVYGLLIEAPGHRPGWHLISHEDFLRPEGDRRVERDEVILRLLLVPTRAEPADLAGAHARLVTRGSPFVGANGLDAAAFAGLPPAAAMAFLNIEAKLRATSVDGRSLASFVAGIESVAVDRVFVLLRSAARALVDASAQFSSAPGHRPLHLDSWKHKAFPVGNLQLSFTKDVIARPGFVDCHSVDADIDLAQGVGHGFEWLRNNVFQPGHKTDQTAVYALLFDQNILPEYTLAAVAARAAAPRPRARPPLPAPVTRARAARPAKRAAKRASSRKSPRKRGESGRTTKRPRGKAVSRKRSS
jgi:hypothetical protein